jgi:hypothetical protein
MREEAKKKTYEKGNPTQIPWMPEAATSVAT